MVRETYLRSKGGKAESYLTKEAASSKAKISDWALPQSTRKAQGPNRSETTTSAQRKHGGYCRRPFVRIRKGRVSQPPQPTQMGKMRPFVVVVVVRTPARTNTN